MEDIRRPGLHPFQVPPPACRMACEADASVRLSDPTAKESLLELLCSLFSFRYESHKRIHTL
jgi:hypothetical protein